MKKTIQKKKKIKFKKNGLRYWLELGFITALIVAIIFDVIYKDFISDFNTETSDTIIVLLPLILTILSITLSMPKELIYGIEKAEFRKLRSEKNYDFLE